MSLIKKYRAYVKNLSLYFGASIIPMLINLIINPLVAMNMSHEDYAIAGYFTSFNTLLQPIIVFYMLHYYQKRFFELDDSNRLHLKAVIFKGLIGFSALMSVICFIIVLIFISFDDNFSFPIFPYLALSVFTIPLTGIYSLELSDSRMARKGTYYFRLSTITSLILIALTILLVIVLKLGAFGKLLAPLTCNLLVFIYLIKKNKFLLKEETNIKELFSVLKFCYPLAIGAMLGYFTNGFDKTFLEKLGDVQEYGSYCVGSSIAMYLMTFSTAIGATFQPDLYQSVVNNDRKRYLKVVLLETASISIIVLSFIILCPFLVYILTAGRYMDSLIYAQIISLSCITSRIYYIINDFTIAKGYPSIYLVTTIIGTILIIILMNILVDCYAFIGAAIMVSLSFLILTIVNFGLIRIKRIKL